MPKELVYPVKIVPDEASFKNFSSRVTRGQEQVKESTRDTIKEINTEISRLELLEQTGSSSVGQLEEKIERLNATLATAPKQTDKVIRAQKRLARLQERVGQQTRSTTSATRGYNKVQSNANQTLFTFGDLLNDSQQFQYGFASGTRAIGNNIGFAAEQFSQISSRTGSFKSAVKALGASLLGPGGLILGINIVVTALTVFGDRLFETGKKAKNAEREIRDFKKEIQGVSAALEKQGQFGEDPFNIKQLQFQREELERRIQTIQNTVKELNPLSKAQQQRLKELRQLRDLQGQSLNAAQKQQLTNLARLDQQRKRNLGLINAEQKALEKRKEELKEVNKELRTQLRIKRRTEDFNRQQQARVSIEAAPRPQEQTFAQLFDTRKLEDAALNDLRKFQAVRLNTIQGVEQQIARLQEQRSLATTQRRRDQLQTRIQIWQQELAAFKNKEQKKTQIQAAAEAQRSQMTVQALTAAADIIGQAFNQSKEFAIAQTLISTYASAQKAYESQLAIPTPDAPVRAAKAAGIAVLQGLARVAQIASTNLGGNGGGGAAASGRGSAKLSEGFQSGEIARSRPDRQVIRQQSEERKQEVVINLRGDIADSSISKRAEVGRKKREKTAVRLRSD